MREIVIDTETTGLDPQDGHRIVEIACSSCSTMSRPAGNFTAMSTPSATCRRTRSPCMG